jgi:hypothetical protein
LTKEWEIIGYKCAYCPNTTDPCAGAGLLLNEVIAQITGIKEEVLADYGQSRTLSVEEKAKWMEYRMTTKPEDIAYCLL